MAVDLLDRVVGARRLRVVVSDRGDGDFHPHRVPSEVLDARQRSVFGRRISMVDQVHGTSIITGTQTGTCSWPVWGEADVIVAGDAGDVTAGPIGVWAADCASIVLFGAHGTVVGCHAGWRGLAAGVVDVAAGVLTGRDEPVVAAVAGPMIHAECYAFEAGDLAAVAAGVRVEPAAIAGVTTHGEPALDVPAAVAAALARHGITADAVGACTGCDPRWFSHRVGRESERHVLVAWSEPTPGTVER